MGRHVRNGRVAKEQRRASAQKRQIDYDALSDIEKMARNTGIRSVRKRKSKTN